MRYLSPILFGCLVVAMLLAVPVAAMAQEGNGELIEWQIVPLEPQLIAPGQTNVLLTEVRIQGLFVGLDIIRIEAELQSAELGDEHFTEIRFWKQEPGQGIEQLGSGQLNGNSFELNEGDGLDDRLSAQEFHTYGLECDMANDLPHNVTFRIQLTNVTIQVPQEIADENGFEMEVQIDLDDNGAQHTTQSQGLLFTPNDAQQDRPAEPGSTYQSVAVVDVGLTGFPAADLTSMTIASTGGIPDDIAQITIAEDIDGDGVYTAGVDNLLDTGSYDPVEYELTTDFGGDPLAFLEDESRTLIVAYDFDLSAGEGADFTLEISAVEVDGEIDPLGIPFPSATVTIQTVINPVLTVTATAGPDVTDPVGDVPVADLAIDGIGESGTITSLGLRMTGTVDDVLHLNQVALYRDANNSGEVDAADTLLGSGVFETDGETISMAVTGLSVGHGGRANLLVTAGFSGVSADGRTLGVELINLVATGSPVVVGLPVATTLLTIGESDEGDDDPPSGGNGDSPTISSGLASACTPGPPYPAKPVLLSLLLLALAGWRRRHGTSNRSRAAA